MTTGTLGETNSNIIFSISKNKGKQTHHNEDISSSLIIE